MGYFSGADLGLGDVFGNLAPVFCGNAVGAFVFLTTAQRALVAPNLTVPLPPPPDK